MEKKIISTEKAPQAIGTYSQAVAVGSSVYLSGQIPLDPQTMTLVEGEFSDRVHQVFKNLSAVCEAAGGSLQDMVKVQVYLTDMNNFAQVNEVMAQYFDQPYPARAAVAVKELPKGTDIEIDGIMQLNPNNP